MRLPIWEKKILIFFSLAMLCSTCFAGEELFRQARELQRKGEYGKAIETFKEYLSQPLSISSCLNICGACGRA